MSGRTAPSSLRAVALLLGALVLAGCAGAPSPTFDEAHGRVTDAAAALRRFDPGGRVSDVQWTDDAVLYTSGGRRRRCDVRTGAVSEVQIEEAAEAPRAPRRRDPAPPPRGRQRDSETSPDGRWVAVCRAWNVTIEPVAAAEEDLDEAGDAVERTRGPLPTPETIVVTTEGHRKLRFGTASWVYGEELEQWEAMWWSPDSTRLVFYEFDEREVPDFHLLEGLDRQRTKVLTEGYPKPGDPNPVAALRAFDLETGTTTIIDTAEEGDWYVYGVRFSPDGKELLYHQLNRRQNVLHLKAADLDSGASRAVLTERQPTWQEPRPTLRFVDDTRFLWETEAHGTPQLVLRDLDGRLLAELSPRDRVFLEVERVDETAGIVDYRASGGGRPLDEQLYRVALDGTGRRQLTRGSGSLAVGIAPDGRWLVVTREAVDRPPRTALLDARGREIAVLAEPDGAAIEALGYPATELFTVKAADGVTDLHGWLCKPRCFDPRRRYPLVIDVYGGPTGPGFTNRFQPGAAECDYGVIVARLENRGCSGRGTAFHRAVYGRLGDVDLADQAAGAQQLAQRPYIDPARVGICGHSYGGFMAALGVLRHGDVFSVAVAVSSVTDWRNYDSIYAERYMGLPEDNEEGYDAGSCMTYADDLAGHLLLMHGMVDDNVHPNNAWQLIRALQRAGKEYDVEWYPAAGHSLPRRQASRRRWEYLYRHLVEAVARQ